MRKFILPALLTLSSLACAQRPDTSLFYRTAINFSPFAMMQIDYTLLVGTEYRLRPRLSLTTDIGYIFYSAYLNRQDNRDRRSMGFILRPGLRWYIDDDRRVYLQPQVFYKQVDHKLNGWLGKETVNGVPAYEQLQDFTYRRRIIGFNFTGGVIVPFTRSRKSFLDFYLGIGVRRKSAGIRGEPRSTYQGSTPIGRTDRADHGSFPGVPGGMRLVFVL